MRRPAPYCKTLFVVGLLALPLPVTVWAANKTASTATSNITLYRYTNDQGTPVTSSKIPPQYARKGYQIVTLNGTVLQEIPPEPTPEERQKIEDEARNKATAAQQAEYDKKLLLRYNSLADIRKAKDRKLAEIDGNIKILQGNILSLQQQQDAEKAKAVDFERNGTAVPPAIQQKIRDTANDISVSNSKLKESQEDRVKEAQQFDNDMARFQSLKPESGNAH